MTSLSRRDLGGERLRSFDADPGMLLQFPGLWSLVKRRLGVVLAVRRDGATRWNPGRGERFARIRFQLPPCAGGFESEPADTGRRLCRTARRLSSRALMFVRCTTIPKKMAWVRVLRTLLDATRRAVDGFARCTRGTDAAAGIPAVHENDRLALLVRLAGLLTTEFAKAHIRDDPRAMMIVEHASDVQVFDQWYRSYLFHLGSRSSLP